MYTASSAFHTAVANGAHQIALLIFDNAVFTNDDIDVSRGISFNDYFNMEEDLAIGQVLSNEIDFSIFNDRGMLNNYEFGEFTATIGAQIGNSAVTANGYVQAESTYHTYVGSTSAPYLKRDGIAVISQPASAVRSILIYNGTVYCGLANGTAVAYSDADGSAQGVALNAFMLGQMTKWNGKGIAYDAGTRILRIWQGSTLRTYEFVPLGVFNAERPNVPTVIEIDFHCNDRMMRFERDMPSDAELGITYPCTFGTLYEKMCEFLDIPYRSSVFINSTASLSARPDDFSNVTMREVLRWLAEAACANARFDREGYLVMDWVRSTAQAIDEHGYSEFAPYWYETRKVTKLYNRASDGSYDITSGDGDEAYLIQDNPLLRGVR